uniref:WRKY19-like zinc finger domain-containing protein n=1 Tax=Globisporangium ultimum (strain ATCC 200006 / CBS 805.95 / DAOM BR144) TaxID=431595 RepID=K3X8K2_GLOUD
MMNKRTGAHDDVRRKVGIDGGEGDRHATGGSEIVAQSNNDGSDEVSLAARMQDTYPFASPVDARTSHRIDVIMNDDAAEDDNQYENRNDSNILNASELPGKSSIAFILGHSSTRDAYENESHEDDDEEDDWSEASSDTSSLAAAHVNGQRSAGPSSRSQIKKSRICKFENCTRYVVNRGLCIGHGGGKRCAMPGCTSSAKNLGVCWKHGGSTKCTIEGCDNRAKSRGVCWSHGGGKNCSELACTKTAVSNGLCWAHGGGKRCVVEGCKKPAYERNGNLCSLHQQQQSSLAS